MTFALLAPFAIAVAAFMLSLGFFLGTCWAAIHSDDESRLRSLDNDRSGLATCTSTGSTTSSTARRHKRRATRQQARRLRPAARDAPAGQDRCRRGRAGELPTCGPWRYAARRSQAGRKSCRRTASTRRHATPPARLVRCVPPRMRPT
jgi:hypothetical protein